MTLKEITLKYFNDFSNKDISSLKKVFANDIVLRDWEIEAKGIDAVIKANQNIFDNVISIVVDPQNLYQEANIVIGELKILINDSEIIYVVDLLEFNKDNKIKRIFAYKGN
tara:strand:- start:69 stop:401 length:333 start_codon:yes stop_codon:yes gene_type:complete